MTFEEALGRQQDSFEKTVFFECQLRIGGACRIEPAVRSEQRRDKVSVRPYGDKRCAVENSYLHQSNVSALPVLVHGHPAMQCIAGGTRLRK